jgi:hypothetical protein
MSKNGASKFNQGEGRSSVLVGIVLGGLLGASGASAQAVVADPIHTFQTLIGHMMGRLEAYSQRFQDATQYAKEIQHFQSQIEHYRQQLVTAGSLAGQASLQMTMDFEERPLDYGILESCPSPDGASVVPQLAQLFQRTVPNLQGNITMQQHGICQGIVLAQNARFNEQVRMLKNIRKRDGELKGIEQQRARVGTSQGELSAVDFDMSQFLSRATMDMQYSQSAMVAYDGLIASLNDDQQRLAKVALGGKPTALGRITQGAALKGALQTLKQQDR